MSKTLQMRGGNVSGLPSLAARELGITVDQPRLYSSDGSANKLLGVLDKIDATTAPTVNDDAGDGYSERSLWVDVTHDKTYICADATIGAAVWQQTSPSSSVTPAALTKTDDTNVTLTLGGTPTTALLQATSLTLGWTGTLAVGRGGTGVGSVTTSPTASAFAGWDANSNLSASNFLEGWTSTASSGGTLTLTVASTRQQIITGSTSHTVKLPVVSTLSLGTPYEVINTSTGSVTVQSSGGSTVATLAAGQTAVVSSNATSGTGATVWTAKQLSFNTVPDHSLIGNFTGGTAAPQAYSNLATVVTALGVATTSTGAAGSEPGSPNAGDIYLPNNGFALERYSGSVWSTWGPLFPLTDPTTQTWTSLDSSETWNTYTRQGFVMAKNTNGGAFSLSLRYKAFTSTSNFAYFGMLMTHGYAGLGFGNAGVAFYESGTGKMIFFGIRQLNDGHMNLIVVRYTNKTTVSSTPFGPNINNACRGPLWWFRVKNDNTTLHFDFSMDGQYWFSPYTEGKTAFFTTAPDKVGVAVDPYSALSALTLLSYNEAT